VVYVKRTAVKRFVITDAAMNDLIRPVWYGSYHDIAPVVSSRRKTITADIVGSVCESGDFFAQGRRITEVRAGELLAIMSAGAYGMTMASNYNSRPRPAEVLVSSRRVALARPREKVEDLVDSEKIAAWLR
jgi:diaminopimelate decarboxylase